MTETSTKTSILRIGSRGSALAMIQAGEVQSRLAKACGIPEARIEIKTIRTTGDVIQGPLADAGGKGLFTKEIEEALLAGMIDLAVHSSKDLPATLPAGLMLSAFLPREDARDAFVSRKANTLRDLPKGASVGTSSPRRRALLKRMRPDLSIVPFRGNVDTRIRKVESGEVDATVLALAGLKRLGRLAAATSVFAIEEFLPAAGQGAIAIETREDDARIRALIGAIGDPDTACALAAERAFLAVLDGTCRTPIAGHAQVSATSVHFRGLIARIDGSEALEVSREGPRADAAVLGAEAGRELKRRAGPDFFVPD